MWNAMQRIRPCMGIPAEALCTTKANSYLEKLTIMDPSPSLSSTSSPGLTRSRKTLVTSQTHLTLVHATNPYLAPSVCQTLFWVLDNDSPCFDRIPETLRWDQWAQPWGPQSPVAIGLPSLLAVFSALSDCAGLESIVHISVPTTTCKPPRT